MTSGRPPDSLRASSSAGSSGSATPARSSEPPALSGVEFARWIWRQLTSMRVALMLLFLLAIAAIPGSIIPQNNVNPLLVDDFKERNPGLSRWYERLGLFDVFAAPWFAAIYLALLVSLVGCILPRTRNHWRAIRATPPATPRRLERMPAYRRVELDGQPDEVLAAARAELKSRRYRLAPPNDHVSGASPPVPMHTALVTEGEAPETWSFGSGAGGSVAGEIGFLRETGNLVFHLALVVVLLAVALGALFGYRGAAIVPEGDGFANTIPQYDSLSSGALFDPRNLPPFALDVDEFEMEFYDSGPARGSAADFEARVRFTPEPGAPDEERTIRVNEPLNVDGTLIHVLNPGYAPVITVRDADGTVLADGPVPFRPQDGNFTSPGVREVPVGATRGLGEDIGIDAIFYPTAVVEETGPVSIFPGARNAMLHLTAFHGDLGIDGGTAKSVFRLNTADLTQFTEADGEPFQALLAVGETVELPDGYGSITFDGYVTWVNLQVSRNAGKEIALIGALAAVAGLLGSLYVRRRRVWVRVAAGDDGRTVVEVAGLARSEGGDLDGEVSGIADGLLARLPARVDQPAAT